MSQSLADAFGLARPDGALVASVVAGGAAAAAGLRPGDVITEINGEPVLRSGDLTSRIGMLAPGDTVRLKVWRDKAPRDMTARLGRADEAGVPAAKAEPVVQPGSLGLQLRPLEPEERKRLGVNNGLVIEGVGGPAAAAGIQPGDVLLALNGTEVRSVEQVRALMDKKPRSAALLIERSGERLFVAVDLD
jgi:serine protease Do